jgi:chemotaxis-related protein WspB
MLLLLIQLEADRYALDTAQIAEVLPPLHIKKLPHAPTGIAGAIDYRGVPVPVIDLSELILQRPVRLQLNTRIIVVHYPTAGGTTHLLGLIAENATETIRREASDFVPSGVTNDAASYLGPVSADPNGIIQWIKVSDLLPPSIRDVLFQPAGEA